MGISDSKSSTLLAPVAIWSQLDGLRAQVTLSGAVNVYSLASVWTDIREKQNLWLEQGNAQAHSLIFDASKVSSLDGAGFAFLIDVEQAQQKAGGQFQIQGLDSKYEPLLHEFDPVSHLFPAPTPKSKINFISSTGMAAQNLFEDACSLITFTGHLAADLVWSVRHVNQVRWGDFVNTAVQAGIAALPIVGLVSFLIGVILSFQAAIGMEQFGAVSFVGPLAALGIVREMGPLITAILLAGR